MQILFRIGLVFSHLKKVEMSSEWSDILPVLWTYCSVFPIRLAKRFTNMP